MKKLEKEVFSFLSEQTIATLATISGDGKPHAASIYYSVDKDFTLYFFTKDNTQKHKNIEIDDHVAIVITDIHSVRTVQMEGEAEQVNDKKKMSGIIDNLALVARKHTLYWPPIAKIRGGVFVVYKIKPTKLRYADFREPLKEKAAYATYFRELI